MPSAKMHKRSSSGRLDSVQELAALLAPLSPPPPGRFRSDFGTADRRLPVPPQRFSTSITLSSVRRCLTIHQVANQSGRARFEQGFACENGAPEAVAAFDCRQRSSHFVGPGENMTGSGNQEPPISARFLERAQDPSWWCDHLLTEGPGDHLCWRGRIEEDTPERLVFPVLDAHLDLEVTSILSQLSLLMPGAPPAELGWDDGAHWHPHVFRWIELTALVEHTTSRPPWNDFPDLALALLHRFSVGTTDADVASMRSRLIPVLRQLGLPPDRVERALSRLDWRPGSRPGDYDELVGPGWVRDHRVGWRLDLWWRRELERSAVMPSSLRTV
jgi:hypothetical protein